MSDLERLVRFTLLGREYKFYTGTSKKEMDEILRLVRELIEENSLGDHGTIPVSKIAVMACLNMASKYVKLKQDFDKYKNDSEDRINTINKKIDTCLLAVKQAE